MDAGMMDAGLIAVTGASSGLGREVARQLRVPVVATARRADRLDALATETDGRVIPYVTDVTDADACAEFTDYLLKSGCVGIVLNAGVTVYEAYTDGTDAIDTNLVATNVSANLRLMRGLTEGWIARGVRGRVLIVASLAGLSPVPYQSVYAGTKAFMLNFGLSVREELKGQGITVGVFAPGGIATEMTDNAAFAAHKKHLATVEEVASALIAAYHSGAALTVPGAANKATAAAGRILPRATMARIAERIFRRE